MDGFTKEEVFLNWLGKSSFLRFWSWPNLFRDQGSANIQGDGKEICDLTIIFGNDILLFSSKKIKFNTQKEVNIAWSRWARRAIRDSIKQIKGARRWISDYPNRIFLDPKCRLKIPIGIPDKNEIRFHNIVVCHGIENILSGFNREASFFIDNTIHGECHWDTEKCKPFCIGQITEGDFVHIFNETTIELVLREFDTAKDFIFYIKQREALLCSGKSIKATSESDIIQVYFDAFDEKVGQRLILSGDLQKADNIFIDKGGIKNLHASSYYVEKKMEDQVSYFWDDLIESFSYHILNGTTEHKNWGTPSDVEPSLRHLANSSRFERRVLSTAFIEFYEKALPGQRGTRLCFDPSNKVRAYLFLVLPFQDNWGTHDQYRELRRTLIQDYGYINKLLMPKIELIVGIASKTREAGQSLNRSFFDEGQDCVFFDFKKWGFQDQLKAKAIYDEYVEKGLLKERELLMENITEFPEQQNGFRKKIEVKGKEGNQPCFCGSNKMIKDCCGKSN